MAWRLCGAKPFLNQWSLETVHCVNLCPDNFVLENIKNILTSFFIKSQCWIGIIVAIYPSWRKGLVCSAGPGEFPTQRPVTRSFDVFFDLRLNKRLSKQPWGWWFETPSWSLWRQCNELTHFSCDNCENVCTLSYYQNQIGSMNH